MTTTLAVSSDSFSPEVVYDVLKTYDAAIQRLTAVKICQFLLFIVNLSCNWSRRPRQLIASQKLWMHTNFTSMLLHKNLLSRLKM
jgi:hypothetical protein